MLRWCISAERSFLLVLGRGPSLETCHSCSGPRSPKSLRKLALKYGGLMYLQLGQKPCLVVSTAAAAKEIFRKHDATFASRPPTLAFNILTAGAYRNLGYAPYGPFWRRLRRIANTQLFSPAVHASHEPIRRKEIHYMLKVLVEDSHKGKPIHLKSWLTSVTANNMTMMLSNKRIFEMGVDNDEKKRDFDEMLRRTFVVNGDFMICDYVPYLSFVTKLQGWVSEMQGLRALGASLVGNIFQVDEHRERAQKMYPSDTDYVPDYIDVLLKTSLDDGDRLPDRDIVSLVVGLLNAGTDASANTVEWAMAELMANPDIRKKAQAELDAVVQDRLVQESDIPNLPFLQAIVKENYRMHPSAPLSVRHESHESCVISGCEFPAHTELIVNIFAIHRDPSVYENPDKFDPTRFVRSPEVDPVAGNDFYQLMPFGAGRRMCPEQQLGNTMVTSMLANLLQCFEWETATSERESGGGEGDAVVVDMVDYYSFMSFRQKPLCLLAKPRPLASLLLQASP
uniref:Cytochrome P450 n=1 Tax=Physcomitrium patens TaxID=3218 RepID=A0A2K1IAU0_PHYPA|nr:hypothetical protein PHYPA_030965 [Physcomitrium patens]